MTERYDRRLDFWTTEDDANFVAEMARVEALNVSQVLRRIVRAYRIYTGSLPPPQPPTRANGHHKESQHAV
jgi:hypothetical protein